jgi:probable rRNA maturation factor
MAPGDQRGARLRVVVSDEHGRSLPFRLARWLAGVAPPRAHGLVNVAVVSDRRVRALNRQYRGRDCATDVLSFPERGGAPRAPQRGPRSTPGAALGDIVIARGVARRQARRAGHSEATELRVLALHGLLHLLGYDHERDHGVMARLERRLGRRGGLHTGLIERP